MPNANYAVYEPPGADTVIIGPNFVPPPVNLMKPTQHTHTNTNPAEEKQGISPLVWGPQLWNFLHMVSSTYPNHPTDVEKRQYFTFLLALGNVLPCPNCRNHYKKMLVTHNFSAKHLKDRETFMKFMFDVHNIVNARLHKPVHDSNEDFQYLKHRMSMYKQM